MEHTTFTFDKLVNSVCRILQYPRKLNTRAHFTDGDRKPNSRIGEPLDMRLNAHDREEIRGAVALACSNLRLLQHSAGWENRAFRHTLTVHRPTREQWGTLLQAARHAVRWGKYWEVTLDDKGWETVTSGICDRGETLAEWQANQYCREAVEPPQTSRALPDSAHFERRNLLAKRFRALRRYAFLAFEADASRKRRSTYRNAIVTLRRHLRGVLLGTDSLQGDLLRLSHADLKAAKAGCSAAKAKVSTYQANRRKRALFLAYLAKGQALEDSQADFAADVEKALGDRLRLATGWRDVASRLSAKLIES